ncbi:MAG: peptidoglycan LD-endopeptidase LytH, partial [Gaiellaceae bacterium]|nr:peptidoglycan LD-endopeptidase LytH [Gaiellaceae bacterium]
PTTTTTPPPPTYATLGATRLPLGCVGAGIAAIATTGRATLVLPLLSAIGASAYPGSRPFLTLGSAGASGSGCSSRSITLRNVSLFGGAVTAGTVSATDGRGSVFGLRLGGSAVSLGLGQTIAVGSWGLLTRGAKSGRISAPLALRLVQTHSSVPAGTTIYLGFAAIAKPRPPVVAPVRHHHHHRPTRPSSGPSVPQPLNSTPWLGFKASHYVFPVDHGASYVDTYGAGRSDIYDGWHHGDDLFAPLGTPIVAVADGTLSPIGWNAIGGWRLWLTDDKGNSFYYAHLAGYSRRILHHRHVTAGQVLGFLGRTGDAFTTPPHLHFEVHPHQFVQLGYDGAVNPTTYLQSWRVETLPASQIPAAARLQAPAGAPSQEAAVVWGELLRARHLMPDGQPLVALSRSVRRPFPATEEAAAYVDARRLASSRYPSSASPWPSVVLGLALAALAAASSFAVVRRRRSI